MSGGRHPSFRAAKKSIRYEIQLEVLTALPIFTPQRLSPCLCPNTWVGKNSSGICTHAGVLFRPHLNSLFKLLIHSCGLLRPVGRPLSMGLFIIRFFEFETKFIISVKGVDEFTHFENVVFAFRVHFTLTATVIHGELVEGNGLDGVATAKEGHSSNACFTTSPFLFECHSLSPPSVCSSLLVTSIFASQPSG